ncbi:glutathione S-transferase C-terminal-like protein [Trametes versicolor FP-101664 SS1]|uniref:glutathione S-transferase C-terminal-like protein n=1 Tax=Trametes versicolor (strain FP-101664) TaxID=717944 RepID=UPI000462342E|nr:glutathione S-transferase C-terminal-like protein [Trametes versicolor FP-101664 SS1]EIW54478.1 glutathione S-transferase C-terminal-like protein [Trametes versicolor FP-101664 SS1]
MSNDGNYIHSHATGLAAKTVEQHQAPQDLVLYAGWFCPYVQRSWISLEEKGIPYQYKEVNPYKKEQHFLDINPKGLVPAIEYKGKAMYESLILCEFFEDAFPEHTPHLLTTDPFDRAYVRLWVDHVSKQIVPTFMRLVLAQEPEKQQEHLADFYKGLRTLTDKVRGPYFLGAQFSLVDIALAPWVLRDYILAENRGYEREAAGSAWVAYAKALETRESVLRTQSDKEHYAQIYARYLRNEAQSEAAKAIRAGKPF